jgi:hypothetical protein
MPGTAQASEVTFELHSLGWKAFQDLCLTTVSEVLGHTVQGFAATHDGGRDGAFFGVWKPGSSVGVPGMFAVQCKFTSKREKFLTLNALEDELEKARGLAARGVAENYLLMTNHHLSGTEEVRIKRAFAAVPGIKFVDVLGYEWIVRIIRASARLRVLVPRVYGLGDLSQILDERAYTQAKQILQTMGDDLGKFVLTGAHKRSARALLDFGFVLLLGEPAAGKTSIAATLAVGSADMWGAPAMKVRGADEFIRHWNPEDPKQFFWVDDVFGATQYQRESVLEWNRAFPHLSAAIKLGAKVVMTSRDYIFRYARVDLKMSAFPLMTESKVIIDVQDLQLSEKEQILYNHIKLGDQPREFRRSIKRFLPAVAANRRFLPETARRLGTSLFTKDLPLWDVAITRFVEEPLPFLVETIRNLDGDSRAALALIFMNGGFLRSPLELSAEEQRALVLLGSSIARVREALGALNTTMVLYVHREPEPGWQFKHPTIRDALAALVAEDPELLDIYLAGTPVGKLMQEITCGITNFAGARVVVPQSRYDQVLGRLRDIRMTRVICDFLLSRCDPQFVRRYLEAHPTFLESLPVYSFLSAVPEVKALAEFNKRGFLPEALRGTIVRTIETLAVDTPDAGWLTDATIRSLLTEEEIETILRRVSEDLIPNLRDTIYDWKFNYNSDQDPESYFADLKDTLEAYKASLDDDADARTSLDRAFSVISEVIDEEARRREEEMEDDSEPLFEAEPLDEGAQRGRSVFDDLDA